MAKSKPYSGNLSTLIKDCGGQPNAIEVLDCGGEERVALIYTETPKIYRRNMQWHGRKKQKKKSGGKPTTNADD